VVKQDDRAPLPAPVAEEPRSVTARVAGALKPAAELVGSGLVAMGATFVLAPGAYVAAKTALAGAGIPPSVGALLAPIAAGSAIWGVRWIARRFAK
jgi:hypothetical protein